MAPVRVRRVGGQRGAFPDDSRAPRRRALLGLLAIVTLPFYLPTGLAAVSLGLGSLAGCIDGKTLRLCQLGGIDITSLVGWLMSAGIALMVALRELVPRVPEVVLVLVGVVSGVSWGVVGLWCGGRRLWSRSRPPA